MQAYPKNTLFFIHNIIFRDKQIVQMNHYFQGRIRFWKERKKNNKIIHDDIFLKSQIFLHDDVLMIWMILEWFSLFFCAAWCIKSENALKRTQASPPSSLTPPQAASGTRSVQTNLERGRVKADLGLFSVSIDPSTGRIWNEVGTDKSGTRTR